MSIASPLRINPDTISKALTSAGLGWENVICYGYYGSQAVGAASPNSDEDIFVICDYKKLPERYAKKRHTEIDGADVRLMSYENIRAEFKGMFDVFWLHNFVYTRPDGTVHPYADYVANTRLNAWGCADSLFKAVVHNIGFTVKKVKEYQSNPNDLNRVKVHKTVKRVFKHQFVYLKIERHLTSHTGEYHPVFTEQERRQLLNSAEEATQCILDNGCDPIETLGRYSPEQALFEHALSAYTRKPC